MGDKGKYYITTAIAYTSKIPHIGNTYEAVLTDALARFKRTEGYDVYFLTGTDEHGQKIQLQAAEEGIEPQEHVDHIAGEIKNIWNSMNVSYDQFIRTTDGKHKKIVQDIFKKLYDQGDIYKGKYEGYYCVPCESFFTETQLEDGKCPDCQREVNKESEEAYFFKLSKYSDQLLEYVENNDFIVPESRKNEMINNFIKPGLTDLCVSRTSFDWGIPVTIDEGHVIYVWIDALSNYITALGYNPFGEGDELFNKYWPADVHVIGKDIVRFHTIYWPIILMALDVELPKQVFGHPWLMLGEGKMSKSKGNVIYARDLVKYFGLDPVRFYLLNEMQYDNDGTLTYELMCERINSNLANVLGNLINRTLTMVEKYNDGIIYGQDVKEPIDQELIDLALETPGIVKENMDNFRTSKAIRAVFDLLRRANKYIDETEPWILGRDEEQKPRLNTVLYNLMEVIRIASVLLKPFMPDTGEKIQQQINAQSIDYESLKSFDGTVEKTKINDFEPLFERIDIDEKLEEIKKDIEEKKNKKENKKDKEKKGDKKMISFDDFQEMDLRVAKVIEVKDHPNADRLFILQLEVGDETRQVVSGLVGHFTKEELDGRRVILVYNLEPVELRGIKSEGMILAAENNDGKLALLTADIETGSTVS